ncbi:MAG: SCO family protein, partial [Bacteroidia bacterium]
AFALILFTSCQQNSADEKDAHVHENHSSTEGEEESRTRTPKGSVYDMDMTFTNQLGETVKWESLKGKVQVIAMVFTNCEYACPLITEDIKNIEKMLEPEAANNVQFTLISFDVKNDTTERLLAYYKEKNLNKNWLLLRGSEENVQIVSALLDVKYKPMESGNFSHENVITVIDANGEIVLQREGLEKSPDDVANKIKSLL